MNLTSYTGPRYMGHQENLAVEAVLRRVIEALKVPTEDGHTWLMLKSESGLVPLDESRILEGFISPVENMEAGQHDLPCVLIRGKEGTDHTEQSDQGPGYALAVEIGIAVYMEEPADYRQATDIVAILRRSFLQQRFLDGGAFRVVPPFTWKGHDPTESWPHYIVTAELHLEATSILEVYDENGQTFNDNKW